MMQTSGRPSRPSTAVCATRSIQSWMASVMCGTTCAQGRQSPSRIRCLPHMAGQQHSSCSTVAAAVWQLMLSAAASTYQLTCHPPSSSSPAPSRQHRTHLHRLAQVVAAPLALNDRLVNLASGQVIVARQVDVQEALVVAQVQIGLRQGGGAAPGAVRLGKQRATAVLLLAAFHTSTLYMHDGCMTAYCRPLRLNCLPGMQRWPSAWWNRLKCGTAGIPMAAQPPHLAAVVQHKHLAVLKRRHGAGVHIEVRVDLQQGCPRRPRERQKAAARQRGQRALPPAAGGQAMTCIGGRRRLAARGGCSRHPAPLALMLVTLWPHALSSTPMEEAVTPLPSPLTTPPAPAREGQASAGRGRAAQASRPQLGAAAAAPGPRRPLTGDQHILHPGRSCWGMPALPRLVLPPDSSAPSTALGRWQVYRCAEGSDAIAIDATMPPLRA